MERDELKGCPFCGTVPSITTHGPDWSVECVNAKCPVGSITIGSTEQEVTELWNTRAADQETTRLPRTREALGLLASMLRHGEPLTEGAARAINLAKNELAVVDPKGERGGVDDE